MPLSYIRSLPGCNPATQLVAPSFLSFKLQVQVKEFEKSRSGGERSTKWLGPTVNVLNAFSAAVSGGLSRYRCLSYFLPNLSDLKFDKSFLQIILFQQNPSIIMRDRILNVQSLTKN